jgi:glycosyltransferase 2 family protein
MPQSEKTLLERQEEILRSFRGSRILIPIVLGLGVVFYVIYSRFKPEDFARIQWNTHTFLWLSFAVFLLMCRHFTYALRLYILAGGAFSYRKCIELLFIWEFSTAIAPTSAGGAAVALFVLTLEKITAARTAVIVVYKILLDSMFFTLMFIVMFSTFGYNMIRPNAHQFSDLDALGYGFLTFYCAMLIEATVLGYGLFINPDGLAKLLDWGTRLPLIKRFREKALKFGTEISTASLEMRDRPFRYHLSAFGATILAWTFRFALINCIVIAFSPDVFHLGFWAQVKMYARFACMYQVTLFSPSPGGAGFAEAAFSGFMTDYIPANTGLVVAFIWRLITYYPYLIAGAIVIPNWIRKLVKDRQAES